MLTRRYCGELKPFRIDLIGCNLIMLLKHEKLLVRSYFLRIEHLLFYAGTFAEKPAGCSANPEPRKFGW